jgi:predicted nucleic acid-binding protein
MILVDTPVWSLALRRKPTDLATDERRITQVLYRLIDEGQVQLLGAVRQELLSGLRQEAQFRRLRDYLRDFPDVRVETDDYEEAARSSNECRSAGISASPVDMLICAVAVRHGWDVFTADRDFGYYQSVLKFRLLSTD